MFLIYFVSCCSLTFKWPSHVACLRKCIRGTKIPFTIRTDLRAQCFFFPFCRYSLSSSLTVGNEMGLNLIQCRIWYENSKQCTSTQAKCNSLIYALIEIDRKITGNQIVHIASESPSSSAANAQTRVSRVCKCTWRREDGINANRCLKGANAKNCCVVHILASSCYEKIKGLIIVHL